MVIEPVIGETESADSDTARTTVPTTGPGSRRDVLVCRVRGLLVALPIEAVVETMRPLPVHSLPGLPGYVAGVAMIRGAGTPVVDLGALLDGGSPSAAGRFVSVSAGSRGSRGSRDPAAWSGSVEVGPRPVCLAVDAVVGIRTLDDAAAGRLPPLLGAVGDSLLASLGSLDPELLYVLETANLVDEDVWATLTDGVTAWAVAGTTS